MFEEGLTFDDVLLVPARSEVLPADADPSTELAGGLELPLPVLSAAMDTVSDHRLAAALARLGGLAVLHKNMSVAEQAESVRRVKEAPVETEGDASDEGTAVSGSAGACGERTRGGGGGGASTAGTGLDGPALDEQGRLLVAAAVGAGDLDRAVELAGAGVDLIVVDSAHGHSVRVLRTVERLKDRLPSVPLMAGNVATAEGVDDLALAGADIVKVGIGPGSICTTRLVAGVGVPQFTALLWCGRARRRDRVKLVADGGLKNSGDCVKALAAGADAVMLGRLFAGAEEAPGRVIIDEGRRFKVYRGMGSRPAMEAGSAERYGQGLSGDGSKFVPEGVEAVVELQGPLAGIVYELAGGIRAGMGYLGAPDLAALRAGAVFVRQSPQGLLESRTHSVRVLPGGGEVGR